MVFVLLVLLAILAGELLMLYWTPTPAEKAEVRRRLDQQQLEAQVAGHLGRSQQIVAEARQQVREALRQVEATRRNQPFG